MQIMTANIPVQDHSFHLDENHKFSATDPLRLNFAVILKCL
ncbi:hypothetical protein DSUL_50273 [Desulfovibrionales bacterium]